MKCIQSCSYLSGFNFKFMVTSILTFVVDFFYEKAEFLLLWITS